MTFLTCILAPIILLVLYHSTTNAKTSQIAINPTVPRPTTSAPRTITSTTTQHCEDDEKYKFLCEEEEIDCTSKVAKYVCRKSCNVCSVTVTTPLPCKDDRTCQNIDLSELSELCGLDIPIAKKCPISCKEERCKTTSTASMSTKTTLGTTAETTTSSSFPSTTRPSTPAPCKDHFEDCLDFREKCGVPFVRESCPGTCGLCPTTTSQTTEPSTPGPCKDNFEDCQEYHVKCGIPLVRDFCPETCGACPTTTLMPTLVPCIETNDKYCKEKIDFCKKYMFMLHFCPKTCGYC